MQYPILSSMEGDRDFCSMKSFSITIFFPIKGEEQKHIVDGFSAFDSGIGLVGYLVCHEAF